MKLWPFSRTENRQTDYGASVAKLLLSAASGSALPSAGQTYVAEFAGHLYGNVLAACTVTPMIPALHPDMLAQAGRDLAINGEWLAVVEVDQVDGISLLPASTWTVLGDPDPRSWYYVVQLSGPNETITRTVPAAGVIHLTYATRSLSPWQGVSPLRTASWTSQVVGGAERQLAQESSRQGGYLLPVPDSSDQAKADAFSTQIAELKGRLQIIETTSAGWGEGQAAAPQRDFTEKRLGASPPEALVDLRSRASMDLLSSYGIHPSLVLAEAAGPSQRESWRRFLEGYVKPLTRRISNELSMKLNQPVQLETQPHWTTDVRSVTSALASLVKAGETFEAAAERLGLDAG